MRNQLQVVEFDHQNPTCPQCQESLKKGKKLNTVRYEEQQGTLHIVMCKKCHTLTGYFVLDNPDPNDPYLLGEITND